MDKGNPTIHIISFDIPWPTDYGGVIDVFYKIKALKESGISIILHCFYKDKLRTPAPLEFLCEKVFYYKRSRWKALFSLLPYIVATRSNINLINNLLHDNHPILFEGLHTTFFLGSPQLQDRQTMVRLHNIEHNYYWNLFKSEKHPIKKLFFFTESIKLKNYEKKLRNANVLFPINPIEKSYFKKKITQQTPRLLRAFSGINKVSVIPGAGSYFLYHGNLSVPENTKIAELLISISKHILLPLVLAGKNPPSSLKKKVAKLKNITLIPNPNNDILDNLIHNAQGIIVFSEFSAGIKIKLLTSLFKGRFCIANSVVAEGTGLKHLLLITNDKQDLIKTLNSVKNQAFTTEMIEKRKLVLEKDYSDTSEVNVIISEL